MFNELKLYCKSEGITEYLRMEAKVSSEKNDGRDKGKTPHNDKRAAGSVKRAG